MKTRSILQALSRLFLAALIAAASLSLTGCSKTSPGEVVQEFGYRIDDNDIEGALGLLSVEAHAMVGRDKLVAMLSTHAQQIDQKGGVQDIEILSEEIRENEAIVRSRTVYGDNSEEETPPSALIQEEGEWKLAMRPTK